MEQFIQKLAKDAGKIVFSKFRKIRSVKSKEHPKDLLTSADLAANNFIVRAIRQKFPEHGLITEERYAAAKINKPYTWVADPLDGTTGFVHQLPSFCTGIALLKGKQPFLAAVYDPVHDELFFARAANGAFLNGKKVKPVVRTRLSECAGSFLHTRSLAQRKKYSLAIYQTFFDHEISFIRPPAIIINEVYVALGRLDFMAGRDFHIWDLAAGYLIMKEAGVKVTNLKGQPWTVADKTIFAARPVIYKQYYPILKKALKL